MEMKNPNTIMNKIDNIKDIPKRKYEGYIWLSDQEKPKVLQGETIDFSKPISIGEKEYKFIEENHNPFIVEALLYAKNENISVSVKHTGKYQIHEIDLNNLPENAVLEEYADNEEKQKLEYLPHRLNGIKKLNFKQLWVPEEDENCESEENPKGMEVLKMKALIFTGFTKS